MLILLHVLLTFKFVCCIEKYNFETKTVTPGQNVTLTCPRPTSTLYQDTLYWIRLVSGNWPEFLGATFNFEFDEVSKIPRIQTKQEPGEFLLHITEAQRIDTGLYYCIKVRQLDLVFINGTFLLIKGEESNVTVVPPKPPSGSVDSENPETLRCSVLAESERKTCSLDNRVYWFRTGLDNSHPSLLYLHENSGDECEKSLEPSSAQKCFYNFSETFDAGNYYCAVAACGQILFGNAAKLRDDDSQDVFLILFCSTLVLSLVVISWLIYKIKKATSSCCNDPVSLPNTGDNQSQQRDENALVYSAPMFNKNKTKKRQKNVKTAQEETVYNDVKTFK